MVKIYIRYEPIRVYVYFPNAAEIQITNLFMHEHTQRV